MLLKVIIALKPVQKMFYTNLDIILSEILLTAAAEKRQPDHYVNFMIQAR